jgi:hypothetical protein
MLLACPMAAARRAPSSAPAAATDSAASCSLPPGKWKYTTPLGEPLSAITWLSPVAPYPCRLKSSPAVRSSRSRVWPRAVMSSLLLDRSIDFN